MDQEYYIKKWLSGSLTEEERQEFERSETYKELQQLDQALQAFKAPKMDLDDSYSQLKQSSEPETPQIKVHWWKPVLAMHAAKHLNRSGWAVGKKTTGGMHFTKKSSLKFWAVKPLP